MAADDYVITIANAGNNNYNGDVRSAEFHVDRATTSVTVPAKSVVYGSSVVVTLSLKNASTVNASTVVASLSDKNGNTYNVLSVNGNKVTVNAANLNAGEYTLSATTVNDANHSNATGSAKFTVTKANSLVNINSISNVTYGSPVNITFNVQNSTAVTYIVKTKNGSVAVSNTTVNTNNIILSNLAAGDYIITIANAGNNNYNGNVKSAEFHVDKANASTVVASLSDKNGNTYNVLSVNGNKVTVNAANINAGEYTLSATTVNDANHTNATASAKFTVTKANSLITINPIENVTYANPVTVNFNTANVTGVNYTVKNKNGNIVINSSTSSKQIVLRNLDAGNYTITIINEGTQNYVGDVKNATFSVKQAGSDVNISEFSVVYGESLSVNVNLINSTGITVNKNYISVKGNTIIVNASKLDAGEYSFNATTVTDNNHYSITKTFKFNVIQAQTNLIAGNDSINVGQNATVRVTLSDDATGNVSIKINNILYTSKVANGSAVIYIPNLSAGKYNNLPVVYSGDNNYKGANTTANIQVDKIYVEWTSQIANTTLKVDDTTVISISNTVPGDVSGKLLVSVDNAKYNYSVQEALNGIVLDVFDHEGIYNVNITFIENEMFYSSISNSYRLNVTRINPTLTPDVSSPNYFGDDVIVNAALYPYSAGGNVTVIIAGKNYTANVENGAAVISISNLSVGTYSNIPVIYSGDYKYAPLSQNIAFEVSKAKLNMNFKTSGSEIIVGDNVTVTLTDITPSNASGLFNATVNGEEFGVFTIDELKKGISVDFDKSGCYDVSINLIDNPNYEYGGFTANIVVNHVSPTISVNVSKGTKVGDVANVDVTLPENAAGNITVYVDNELLKTVNVNDTVICVPVYNLTAGNHTVVVYYSGDDVYTNETFNSILEVSKVNPFLNIGVGSNPVAGGNVNIVVSLPGDATGNVSANVNGKTYSGKVNKGKYSFTVDNLNATAYDVSVTYSGDGKYNTAYNTTSFTVSKANSTVSADVSAESKVGSNLSIAVTVTPAAAGGNVTIYVDNVKYAVYTIGDDIKVSGLNAGVHTISVQYNGDNNHNPSNIADYSVNVSKNDISNSIAVQSTSASYGNNITVSVSLPEDAKGNVTVTVNGNKYVANVKNGAVDVVISDLSAGVYTNIPVVYSGDDKYYSATDKTGFEVSKAKLDMNFSLSNTEITARDNVTVVLTDVVPGDALGLFNVSVDGNQIGIFNIGELKQGIDINFDESGFYEVTINLLNSANYDYDGFASNIVVNSIDAAVSVNVDKGVKVGDAANINITLPEGASGNITVYVDNKLFDTIEINDTNVHVTVDNLTAGNHTVVVSYSGDDVYSGETVNAILEISKLNPVIVINTPSNLVAGQNVNITVSLPEDATGNVSANVNGKVYSGKLNKGKYSFVVSNLNATSYDVNVTYSGDAKYNAGYNTAGFTVNKADTSVSADISGEIKVGDNLTVDVSVSPDTATGTVNVYVDNSVYRIYNIGDDIVVGGLTAGVHTIGVKYNGDSNYNACGIAQYTVNVTKYGLDNISIKCDPVEYGNNVTVVVSLPQDAAGNVSLTLGGKNYTVSVENGAAAIVIPNLTAGNYNNVCVTYSGDDKYSSTADTIDLAVSKANLDLKFNMDKVKITVGDNVNIALVSDAAVNGSFSITLNNKEYGIFTLNELKNGVKITFNKSGSYKVTVNLVNNPNYAYGGFSGNVEVNQITPDVKVSVNESIKVYETADVVVSLPGDATGSLDVYVDSKYINKFAVNTNPVHISISNLTAGNHKVTVNYSGDNLYAGASNSASFKVIDRIASELNFIKPVFVVNTPGVIDVSANFPAGTLAVYLDGAKQANVNIVSGKGKISLAGLSAGNHTVKVVFDGNNDYKELTKSVDISVIKKNSTINVSSSNNIVTVTLAGDANGKVTVGSDSAPLTRGVATVNVSNLAAGDNILPLVYSGDDVYNPIYTSITVSMESGMIVTAPNLTKYVGGDAKFVVYVKDFNGNPIANQSVLINISGNVYKRTANASGAASMPINLVSGVYNVTVSVGDIVVDSTVSVLTTVNGSDVTKMFKNATQYYATFRDASGNYLAKGSVVEFNINGIMYKRSISGNDGTTKLNINLPQGEYIITAYNNVTGERSSNIIKILARLTENNDLVKYQGNTSQYRIKVLDDYGNAVGANETVTFNINGVMYNRHTDASGYVRLNINLGQGDYVITAKYGDSTISNNVKILPVIVASDLTKNYGTRDAFNAKLLDSQGNAAAGKNVTFNINGVFYKRVANSEGIVKLNINLPAGDYIITTYYDQFVASNKITVLS